MNKFQESKATLNTGAKTYSASQVYTTLTCTDNDDR